MLTHTLHIYMMSEHNVIRKVIILATVRTRESQFSLSTYTCKEPKHYGFGNLDYRTSVVKLSRYERENYFQYRSRA